MSNEYRNFLALSYEELETLNLPSQDRPAQAHAGRRRPRKTTEISDGREADQSRHRKQPDLEGRLHLLDYDKKFLLGSYENPDLRRLVDSRLHGAKEKPTFAWALTGAHSTGCPPTSSATARCWSSAMSSTRTARPIRATCAACSRTIPTSYSRTRTTPSTLLPRSRASSSQVKMRSRSTSRRESSSSLIPVAITT